MKKTSLIKILSLGIAITSLGVFSYKVSDVFNKEQIKVIAGDYTKPSDYYSNINFRQNGSSLLSSLRSLISQRNAVTYSGLLELYFDAEIREGTDYLYDYYSNTTRFKSGNSCGTYKGEGDCYNREHSIPKSWWGGNPDKSSQGSDPFIVIPTDGFVNNQRGNMGLGIVGTISYKSNNSYSLKGSVAKEYSSGAPSNVFEPNDEVKGDLARNMLYAHVCWNASSWRSGDGSYFYGGNNNGLTPYATNLLLKWHREDLPSVHEINRNNIIASNWTHNRNPFIDCPDLVEQIWGKSAWYDYTNEVLDDFEFTSGGGEITPPEEIHVESVTLNKHQLDLKVGEKIGLTASVLPKDASNKQVNYSSDDVSVCKVDNNGNITALKEGNATISVTSVDGNKSDTCRVNVTKQEIDTGVSIDKSTLYLREILHISKKDSKLTLTYKLSNNFVLKYVSDDSFMAIKKGMCTISVYSNNELIVAFTIEVYKHDSRTPRDL